MATRLYFSDAAAGVNPAIHGAWDQSPLVAARQLVVTAAGAFVERGSEIADFANINLHVVSFVSAPLAAQTISGTVKGQMRGRDLGSTGDVMAQLVLRVLSGDGLTERGVLLAAHSEAISSAFAASLTNRKFPLSALSPSALTPVASQAGDVLVVEVGVRVGSELARAGIEVGGAAGSDLPENESEASQLNPWIELSGTVTFDSDTPLGSLSGGIGVGIGIGL